MCAARFRNLVNYSAGAPDRTTNGVFISITNRHHRTATVKGIYWSLPLTRTKMIAFNHRITDEPITLVRLASDEGAVLHLVRLQHEPVAPDRLLLESRALCGRWAGDHVVQILTEANAPSNWFFYECQRWRGEG